MYLDVYVRVKTKKYITAKYESTCMCEATSKSKKNGVVIYEDLYFDLAQGQMNEAPNETRTHSCRFASLTC